MTDVRSNLIAGPGHWVTLERLASRVVVRNGSPSGAVDMGRSRFNRHVRAQILGRTERKG
jgi:hypothetical protein